MTGAGTDSGGVQQRGRRAAELARAALQQRCEGVLEHRPPAPRGGPQARRRGGRRARIASSPRKRPLSRSPSSSRRARVDTRACIRPGPGPPTGRARSEEQERAGRPHGGPSVDGGRRGGTVPVRPACSPPSSSRCSSPAAAATTMSRPPAGGGGGQQLFSDNCANCHTLAAAGASGKVGPDLDQLQPGPDLVTSQVDQRRRRHARVQGQADRRADPADRRLRRRERRQC